MDPIISQPEQPQYQAPIIPEHKHFLNKKFVITFVILLLLGTGAYAGIWYWDNQQQSGVYTFEECVESIGGRVLETYPEQCVTSDGQTFVNPNQTAPEPPVSGNIPPDSGQTACTQEAKLCPDGSAVGRTGPNCEFAVCPK